MRYNFLVHTMPKPGRDKEYNDWYDNQHLPDLLKIPGIVAAKRFRHDDPRDGMPAPAAKYLAIYEIDTDDIAGVFKEIAARRNTPAMPLSDAMDAGATTTAVYRVITDQTAGK
jgi:hypothetical protein